MVVFSFDHAMKGTIIYFQFVQFCLKICFLKTNQSLVYVNDTRFLHYHMITALSMVNNYDQGWLQNMDTHCCSSLKLLLVKYIVIVHDKFRINISVRRTRRKEVQPTRSVINYQNSNFRKNLPKQEICLFSLCAKAFYYLGLVLRISNNGFSVCKLKTKAVSTLLYHVEIIQATFITLLLDFPFGMHLC